MSEDSEISLDSAITGETETPATEESTEVSTETAVETEVKTEVETEEPKPDSAEKEKPEEKTETQEEKEERGTLAGLKAERAKRQAAEHDRDALSDRITQLEGKLPKSEPVKAIDPIEDPTGFARQIRQENDASNLKTVLRLSRSAMSRQVDDFADVMSTFTDLAKADKTIAEKMLLAEDPYHFAYTYAKKHLEFKDVENVEEWKDKTRAELREEIKAELVAEAGKTAEAEETSTETAELPNLASKTSVEGGITTASGDITIDDILGVDYISKK